GVVTGSLRIPYPSHFRSGAGDTLWPMVVGPSLSWGVLIGGSWWVARTYPEYGSAGPWAFASLFVITLGIVFWLRWQGGRWESLEDRKSTRLNSSHVQNSY